MGNEAFDLVVVYDNTSYTIVPNVEMYGYNDKGTIFWYEKENHRSFMPVNSIVYFGRLSDLQDMRLFNGGKEKYE